ncbi:MAG: ABC transporter ATP-binding protein [Xanthomonadales bacterium]|nr:ABC transporter ATP-binding protein [Xanthomonadales bacterium]
MTETAIIGSPNEPSVAAAPTTSAIRTRGLGRSVELGEQRLDILQDVDLQIDPGQTVAIVGASGSGKSTLLGLLAGLDRPTRGEVWLQDQALSTLSEDALAALRAERVGFVFQSFQLLAGMTALENAMLPLELAGRGDAEAQARQWLTRVGLGQRLQHTPRQLSGGEQQRVAMARAFVTRPAVLFADEPTGNLDRATGKQVADLLFELNREAGTTLVLVTHDEHLAQRCERVLTLAEGRLVTTVAA